MFITIFILIFLIAIGIFVFNKYKHKVNLNLDLNNKINNINSRSSNGNNNNLTIDDKFNVKKSSEKKELDRILDKINKVGYDNLSKKEIKFLNRISEK